MKLLFVIFVSLFILVSCSDTEERLWTRNVSPTDRYSIEVYGYYPKGKKGVVRLVDKKTNKILEEKKMDSIRDDFSVVSWNENEVSLVHFVTWGLPDANGGNERQGVRYDEH